ncbi:MAG: hypothetical protein HWN81_21190 [Candidatus Lokiarchaeota archaeon]|nr:hypothetical protein [Candidatus Lokiarchaeota archaeon]
MDLKKLLEDLRKLDNYKKTIRWGHYGKEKLQKTLDLLIKELDYIIILD